MIDTCIFLTVLLLESKLELNHTNLFFFFFFFYTCLPNWLIINMKAKQMITLHNANITRIRKTDIPTIEFFRTK